MIQNCKYCGKELISRGKRGPAKTAHCDSQCADNYNKQIKRERTASQSWGKCLCGKEIIGHKRKYCSGKCRKPYKKTCPVCENVYRTNYKNQVCCSKGCKNRLESYDRVYHCKGCGKVYKPKAANRKDYCSRECYFDVLGRVRIERESLKRIAKNNITSMRIIEEYLSRIKICTCEWCKKMFVVDSEQKARGCCSDECYRKSQTKKARLWERSRQPIVKTCIECGKKYKNEHKGKRLCEACRKNKAKASRIINKIKRRYKEKLTKIQMILPINIFIRDNWKCQLCNCDVDELGDPNKDSYANLDHIIPLAKGGHHIMSNVQTLCRKCNGLKTDLMPSEINELVRKNVSICEWNKEAWAIRGQKAAS